ncbi:pirin family protein [Oceanicaulis alexandrii]|uniref:pirin family protein n=1 Tax=Oceanicaulis alexandrii TaxID=153233 RepID=UPI0003B4FF75|nr:pirin family protein [Oceanicaulis alexandrii]
MNPLERILEGKSKDLGGFCVTRILPVAQRRHVGPFVFYDQMGPAQFNPGEGINVRPHPHIGLATVTYLFDGEMDHRDCLGVHQTIYPGDVNWMTAGKGVTHSERTGDEARAKGLFMFGIQVWVALPEDCQEIEPEFHHHGADDLPAFELGDAHCRLILGSAYGRTSPVKVYSPIVYAHIEAKAGAQFDLPEGHEELALHVVSGGVEVRGETVSGGHMAIFTPGQNQASVSVTEDSRLMLLGGQPLGQRFMEWNFVSSRKERIEQAKADWRASIAQGFKDTPFRMPVEENEYIPLPGDPEPGEPPACTEENPTS